MTFIYPYKRKDNDFLIQHSIKCVLKYYPEARCITVGDEVEGIENIPFKDSLKIKGSNVTAKCLYVGQFFDEFVYMNDDFFINERFDFDTPCHSLERLERKEGKASIAWQVSVDNTLHWLEHNNLSAYSYECHQPILFNSAKLFQTMEQIDWKNNEHFVKSLYGNGNHTGDEFKAIENVKLIKPDIKKANLCLTMYGCFSVGQGFMTEAGANFIKQLSE